MSRKFTFKEKLKVEHWVRFSDQTQSDSIIINMAGMDQIEDNLPIKGSRRERV